MKKQTFADYIKSNWAQITCIAGCFFWIITAIYDVKSEVLELRMLTTKDKEIIELKHDALFAQVQINKNLLNEHDKAINRILAILPKEIKREEE